MDALTIEALALGGSLSLIFALRGRGGRAKPARVARPAPVGRLIRDLPHRQRRVARAIVEAARECLERHPPGSFEAFTAREAVDRYLPETLLAYLAVPPSLRRSRVHDNASARDELRRQLRVLHAGLERLREADAHAARTRMTANGAFLDERFGVAGPRPTELQGFPALHEFVAGVRAASARVCRDFMPR